MKRGTPSIQIEDWGTSPLSPDVRPVGLEKLPGLRIASVRQRGAAAVEVNTSGHEPTDRGKGPIPSVLAPQHGFVDPMARHSFLVDSLRDAEREIILKKLTLHGWNRTRTARELGITYRGLLYKIQKLGLTPPEKDDYSPTEGAA